MTGLNTPQRQRAPCQRCGPQGSGAEILTLAVPRAAGATGASHTGGPRLTFYSGNDATVEVHTVLLLFCLIYKT